MTVDHTCRNIVCCNPAHFELVTDRVNVFRSQHMDWFAAYKGLEGAARFITAKEAAERMGYAHGTALYVLGKRDGVLSIKSEGRHMFLTSTLRAMALSRAVEMETGGYRAIRPSRT